MCLPWITFADGSRPTRSGGNGVSSVSKIARLLFISILAAGLVAIACGGGGTTTASPTTGASVQPSPAAGELPKPEQASVRIGISTPNEPVQFAEKLADGLGIYQKYGITSVNATRHPRDNDSASHRPRRRSRIMPHAHCIATNPNTTLVVVAATIEAQHTISTVASAAFDELAKFALINEVDGESVVKQFQHYG